MIGTSKIQKIPLKCSMLNGSFLLLVQNLPGPKQPYHCENWLDNSSIVDIPLNGSILRWARLKLITGTFCTVKNSICTYTEGEVCNKGLVGTISPRTRESTTHTAKWHK